MSYNVLIITEDYVNDEHVVKPLVERIFKHFGKRAQIKVCHDPRFRGIREATDYELLRDKVIKAYPMTHLFLLLVDRDANEDRSIALSNLERRLSEHLKPTQTFFAENAWQEVEVWAMAGHELPAGWSWQEIRAERDSKERFFLPLAKEKGYDGYPHDGRKQMMQDSLKNWTRVLQLCPEDIERLVNRISEVIPA